MSNQVAVDAVTGWHSPARSCIESARAIQLSAHCNACVLDWELIGFLVNDKMEKSTYFVDFGPLSSTRVIAFRQIQLI
jgi:hypothetical protein